MKLLAIIALPFALVTCQRPAPAPVVSAAPPPAQADASSKAAAAGQAAAMANEANPAGAPKETVQNELAVVAANLPPPKPDDVAEARARAMLSLEGKVAEAERAYAAAKGEAAKLLEQIDRERLEAAAKLSAEIARLAREKDAAVQAARDEAAREQRRIFNWIFHGCGGLLILAGVLTLTALSGVPFLGPRIGLGLLSAGALCIGFGIAVDWAVRHPGIVIGSIGAFVLGVIALAFANHWHAKEETVSHVAAPKA